MDTQPTPSERMGSGEKGSVTPESGLTPTPEAPAPASVEAGHAGPPSGGQPPAQNTQNKTLSADDVAAAIAAQPTPAAPQVSPITGPATAEDVDVIEPEWVDKAEQVVQQHSGDPYGEEEAVEDLQRDYLKKRYNYDVADPNADKSKPEGT
jgi:hypothetical protein